MITLEANSDEENAKVKRRKESSNDKLAHKDAIHAYFGKPFHQPGDVNESRSCILISTDVFQILTGSDKATPCLPLPIL